MRYQDFHVIKNISEKIEKFNKFKDDHDEFYGYELYSEKWHNDVLFFKLQSDDRTKKFGFFQFCFKKYGKLLHDKELQSISLRDPLEAKEKYVPNTMMNVSLTDDNKTVLYERGKALTEDVDKIQGISDDNFRPQLVEKFNSTHKAYIVKNFESYRYENEKEYVNKKFDCYQISGELVIKPHKKDEVRLYNMIDMHYYEYHGGSDEERYIPGFLEYNSSKTDDSTFPSRFRESLDGKHLIILTCGNKSYSSTSYPFLEDIEPMKAYSFQYADI